MTFSSETIQNYFTSTFGDIMLEVNDKWYRVPLNSETLVIKKALDEKRKFVVTLDKEFKVVNMRVI